MTWALSHRFDREALPLADRHYNRRKVGSPQFVPPGRCIVLRQDKALWVTSWPFAQYVRHAWPGAWVNSLFRSEGAGRASDLILEAIAITRSIWTPPELGLITFVDPKHVPPKMRRGKPIYGFCYLMAGFKHVGYTKGGLWAWQMLPEAMPAGRPTQIVQPWQFWHLGEPGKGEVKATCFWLDGLDPLVPTTPEETGRHPACWLQPPSEDRWKDRSRTYPGIADAMGEQFTQQLAQRMAA